jgi:hypothetical protein
MQELKEYIYEKLTGDPSIQSLLGPHYLDRVHYQYAPDNQKPPYIVHSYVSNNSHIAAISGFWDIAVWDAGPNPSRVDAIRDRIVALFGRNPVGSIPGFRAVRFYYEAEQLVVDSIPDPKDARIWRYIVRIRFRASPSRDICSILGENSD